MKEESKKDVVASVEVPSTVSNKVKVNAVPRVNYEFASNIENLDKGNFIVDSVKPSTSENPNFAGKDWESITHSSGVKLRFLEGDIKGLALKAKIPFEVLFVNQIGERADYNEKLQLGIKNKVPYLTI